MFKVLAMRGTGLINHTFPFHCPHQLQGFQGCEHWQLDAVGRQANSRSKFRRASTAVTVSSPSAPLRPYLRIESFNHPPSPTIFSPYPTTNTAAVEDFGPIASALLPSGVHPSPAQVLGTNAAVYRLVGHAVSVTPPLASHITPRRPVSAVGHTRTNFTHIVVPRSGPVLSLGSE